MMALTSGARLGPYEILAPIGAGGMGEVYKANDTRLDRAVAIKILPAHFAESAERRQRFEHEAKAISQLNHPHICTLYDVGEQDGIHYLVMEYIEGETLAERLKKGALPLDKAIEYGIQMAEGLDKAHRAGIVHRDLRPGNIMLTKLGMKLLDFGLAKPIASRGAVDGADAPTRQKNLTEARTIVGTLQYMAPEQVEGNDVDARTDLFAFGAVLYEMVTGTKAFVRGSQASLITAIMSSDPPPSSETSPLSPSALDRLVAQCLTKDPEERMQSSHDVMLQLQSIGDASTLVQPTVRQRFSLAWLAAAIVLTAVVTGLLASYLGRTQALPERGPARFAIELPSVDRAADVSLAVSPRGTGFVYVGSSNGIRQLFHRSWNALEAEPLPNKADTGRRECLSPVDPGRRADHVHRKRQLILGAVRWEWGARASLGKRWGPTPVFLVAGWICPGFRGRRRHLAAASRRRARPVSNDCRPRARCGFLSRRTMACLCFRRVRPGRSLRSAAFPGWGQMDDLDERRPSATLVAEGQELYYRNENRVMVVPVETGPTFDAGTPRILFEGSYSPPSTGGNPYYDVSPDGQRFLMLAYSTRTEVHVVLNWFDELKRLVPTE